MKNQSKLSGDSLEIFWKLTNKISHWIKTRFFFASSASASLSSLHFAFPASVSAYSASAAYPAALPPEATRLKPFKCQNASCTAFNSSSPNSRHSRRMRGLFLNFPLVQRPVALVRAGGSGPKGKRRGSRLNSCSSELTFTIQALSFVLGGVEVPKRMSTDTVKRVKTKQESLKVRLRHVGTLLTTSSRHSSSSWGIGWCPPGSMAKCGDFRGSLNTRPEHCSCIRKRHYQ